MIRPKGRNIKVYRIPGDLDPPKGARNTKVYRIPEKHQDFPRRYVRQVSRNPGDPDTPIGGA